jgi:hypothetical protein
MLFGVICKSEYVCSYLNFITIFMGIFYSHPFSWDQNHGKVEIIFFLEIFYSWDLIF